MIIFPAIDLKEGKVVRLWQGRFDQVTVYSSDPLSVAQEWVNCGAKWLHVIDLDGAQNGKLTNIQAIEGIVKSVDASVQVGGGIRDIKDIEMLIRVGVSRVILGTKAVEEKDFVRGILTTYADKIAVSVDCLNGIVTQQGWVKLSGLKATEFAQELEGMGLKYLVYTDIAQDGTLQGPNFKGIETMLAAVHIPVIASGGISSLDDVRKLLAFEPQGLMGAITGKAIYEKTLELKEAIRLCSRNA